MATKYEDIKEINKRYLRFFYDVKERVIVQRYSIIVGDDKRYIEIPERHLDELDNLHQQRRDQLLHIIESSRDNKYIHISQIPLKIEDLKDTSNNFRSWFFPEVGDPNEILYYNPVGLWISCGSAFYSTIFDPTWIRRAYVYNVELNTSNILNINNMIIFRKFALQYRNKNASSIREMIDWHSVKKDYDGLIICPYLGEKIWKRNNPQNFTLSEDALDYIETALDSSMLQIDAFIYEWYRHWDAASGVIWRPSCIKSLKLIDENHWFDNFMKELRSSLVHSDLELSEDNISGGAENTITVLTYNVSWQSTSGHQLSWPMCNNDTDETSERHYSKCINNIIKMIDENGPYDFVFLQEITNLDKINKSNFLSKMSCKIHKSGLESIITFWDKRYNLKDYIEGEFATGRPYQILIFEENIAVMNIHMPHVNKFLIKKNLENALAKLDPSLKKYRFIIAGDFNYAINHKDKAIGFYPNLSISNYEFHINRTYIPTCCVPPYKQQRMHFDHVIDSYDVPISISSPAIDVMASDHLPILAILKEDTRSTSRIKKYKHSR